MRLIRSVVAALCLAASTVAVAQPILPGKNVRLIVPFPPGNAADIQARALAEHLKGKLGAAIIVDNRPGASGAIAMEAAARAAPDGTTLIVASLSPVTITPAVVKTLPYDSQKDFAPIALLGFNDVVLVASPKFGPSTFEDLVALAKREPGTVTFASIGNGTLAHLVMEYVGSLASVKMQHVPYKGSSQAYTDLMSGQVALMADGMPQALAQIKAGRLKALAIFSKQRSPFAPQLPTLAEAGLGLRDFEVIGWTGLLAPAGTPRALIDQLNVEVVNAMQSASMKELLGSQSLRPFPPHGPDDFAKYIRDELAKWRAMARAAGVEGSM